MLLSKEVMIRWNGYTKKWYEEKGYIWTKQNDFFECKIEDVMITSPIKVICKCDYCGREFEKPYRNVFKEREIINKDCCNNKKCMSKKGIEVNIKLHGVKTFMQTEKGKQEARYRNRIPYKKITEIFNKRNNILLTKEEDYENENTTVQFICNNHKDKGIQTVKIKDVKKSRHCCKYGATEHTANTLKEDGKVIYNLFIEKGLIPLFKPEEYIKNSQCLPYKCPKHLEKGVQFKNYATLKSTEGCSFCAIERTRDKLKIDYNLVKKEFDDRNLILLSKIYNNKEELLEYECKKHRGYIQYVRLGGLRKTQCPCDYCREEKYIGNLSQKVRSTLTWWKRYSKNIYKNTCIITGIKGNVDVHHQIQFDTILREALVDLGIEIKKKYTPEELILIKEKVNNKHKKLPIGICLNKDLHILFHIEYGKRECTKKDLDEFIERYFNGEFNDRLKEELKSNNSIRNLEEAKRLASFYYEEN